MIITVDPEASEEAVRTILEVAAQHPGITPRKYDYRGANTTVTEIHLIGPAEIIRTIPEKLFSELPGVRSVLRVSTRYRLIGRHGQKHQSPGFEYNGVAFDESRVHLFAGLCAVDTPENVGKMMSELAANGITTTRMGAYKPRTSPYDFQGLGKECLPWTFELAGKHGIKIVAMEVTNERQIEEIQDALRASGNATGVMLQVGTRNAQNFELLKALGQQGTFPVLFKRGMGITLEESLNACEYIASEGNPQIVFCLRGVKTHLGDPHRNMVDFAHVPVVRRQTKLPVCVDPSHSVGRLDRAPDHLFDIFHVVGQGVICGASMVLVDFHPDPKTALCDGAQALRLEQLPLLVEYVNKVRAAYEDVCAAAAQA